MHEKACEKNPANIKQLIKEQPQSKVPLIIKDVKEIQDPKLSAYFQVGEKEFIERIPEFHGILKLGDEDIPTVLITANDGRILPPFMIEGFVGMFAPDTINEKGMPEEVEAPKEPDSSKPAIEAIRNYAKSTPEVKPQEATIETEKSEEVKEAK